MHLASLFWTVPCLRIKHYKVYWEGRHEFLECGRAVVEPPRPGLPRGKFGRRDVVAYGLQTAHYHTFYLLYHGSRRVVSEVVKLVEVVVEVW